MPEIVDKYAEDIVLAWGNNQLILERDIDTGATIIYNNRDISPNLSDESKEWYLVSPGEDIYVSPFLRKEKKGYATEMFIGPLALKSKVHQPDSFVQWIGAYNKLPKEVTKPAKEKNPLQEVVKAWVDGKKVFVSRDNSSWTPLSPVSEVMTFNCSFFYKVEETNV